MNPRILVVDDAPDNLRLLGGMLAPEGYSVRVARSGEEALAQVQRERPDLMLLDVVMPGLSGYEVCARLRADESTRLLPIVMVTALQPNLERVRGLEVGADDFLMKPVNREELLARVRSLVRVQLLHAKVEEQAQALAEWNQTLEQRVREQVAQLERLGRLRHFFSPGMAELIVADGGDVLLQPHRREVTIVYTDLRGFTAFSEQSAPEGIFEVLHEYHATIGPIVERYHGTIEHFAGDGIMIIFNAPLELDNPQECAVRMALEIRTTFDGLREAWSGRGYDLGLGIGIGTGAATIGAVGYSGRWDYAAIGSVSNLAARLCSLAQHGEILVPQGFFEVLGPGVEGQLLGERLLRGLQQPVSVFNVMRLHDPAAASACSSGAS